MQANQVKRCAIYTRKSCEDGLVSVTQQIDTSNAAGRMMLNILMSFAQFEREMTSDRIRDKIYATRKKGLWSGGMTPFGYKTVDKRLVPDPVTSPVVRFVFARYAESGSAKLVAAELQKKFGPRTLGRRKCGDSTWRMMHVYRILRNAVYKGELLERQVVARLGMILRTPEFVRLAAEGMDEVPFVRILGRAQRWKTLLATGVYGSKTELARALGVDKANLTSVLRLGETMNIIAPPKTGKSWLVTDLALSVATGTPWFGFPCEAGKVLIIDAFYRAMPRGTDENDNGAIADVYNLLDRYAHEIGCAFVLIHHTSKGNQSLKSVTDVGAGAGAQSRAADTHLVLRRPSSSRGGRCSFRSSGSH